MVATKTLGYLISGCQTPHSGVTVSYQFLLKVSARGVTLTGCIPTVGRFTTVVKVHTTISF